MCGSSQHMFGFWKCCFQKEDTKSATSNINFPLLSSASRLPSSTSLPSASTSLPALEENTPLSEVFPKEQHQEVIEDRQALVVHFEDDHHSVTKRRVSSSPIEIHKMSGVAICLQHATCLGPSSLQLLESCSLIDDDLLNKPIKKVQAVDGHLSSFMSSPSPCACQKHYWQNSFCTNSLSSNGAADFGASPVWHLTCGRQKTSINNKLQ
jgi:hypothetical protein